MCGVVHYWSLRCDIKPSLWYQKKNIMLHPKLCEDSPKEQTVESLIWEFSMFKTDFGENSEEWIREQEGPRVAIVAQAREIQYGECSSCTPGTRLKRRTITRLQVHMAMSRVPEYHWSILRRRESLTHHALFSKSSLLR